MKKIFNYLRTAP